VQRLENVREPTVQLQTIRNSFIVRIAALSEVLQNVDVICPIRMIVVVVAAIAPSGNLIWTTGRVFVIEMSVLCTKIWIGLTMPAVTSYVIEGHGDRNIT